MNHDNFSKTLKGRQVDFGDPNQIALTCFELVLSVDRHVNNLAERLDDLEKSVEEHHRDDDFVSTREKVDKVIKVVQGIRRLMWGTLLMTGAILTSHLELIASNLIEQVNIWTGINLADTTTLILVIAALIKVIGVEAFSNLFSSLTTNPKK